MWVPLLWSVGRRRLRDDLGQATVLMAVAMTVLVGFTGLALDGGFAAAQQRFVQNAADAAALAGVQEIAAGTTAQSTINDRIQEYAVTRNPARCAGGTCTQSATAKYVLTDGTLGGTVGTTGSAPSCIGVCVTASLTYSPLFVRVFRPGTITVTATSCATTGATSCSVLPALWAGGDISCHKTINWTGDNATITGDVHSNGDIYIPTPSQGANKVYGKVEAVHGKSVDGLTNESPTLYSAANIVVHSSQSGANAYDITPDPSPLPGWPVTYTINQFRDAAHSTASPAVDGAAVVAAKADTDASHPAGNVTTTTNCAANCVRNGRFYVITGDFKPASGTVLEGLYYATNRFIGPAGSITAGPKGYTIVTEGHIAWGGANNVGTAYSPGTASYAGAGLLFFSNQTDACSSEDAINIASGTGTSTWSGVLFAPNGGIITSHADNNAIVGSMISRQIRLAGGAAWDVNLQAATGCTPTTGGARLSAPPT